MRVCRICGQAYPATSEYFYKTRKYLRTLCKKCEIKRVGEYKQKRKNIVPNRCKTCQRYDRRSGKCMVMIEPFEDCWAWTNDKNWQRKVRQAVGEYRKAQGLGHED